MSSSIMKIHHHHHKKHPKRGENTHTTKHKKYCIAVSTGAEPHTWHQKSLPKIPSYSRFQVALNK